MENHPKENIPLSSKIGAIIMGLACLALPIYVFVLSINALEDPNKFKASQFDFRRANVTEKYVDFNNNNDGYTGYFAEIVFKYVDGDCYYNFCNQCGSLDKAKHICANYIVGQTYDLWIDNSYDDSNYCYLKNGYKGNLGNEILKFLTYLYVSIILLCGCLIVSALFRFFCEVDIPQESDEEIVTSPIHTNITNIQTPKKIYNYTPIDFVESPIHEGIIDIESLKNDLTIIPIGKGK